MMYYSKKEKKIWYLNFLSFWFYEHLIEFTSDKSKAREDSLLNWVSIYLCNFVWIKYINFDSEMCFEVWSSLNASAVKKGFFGLCLINIPQKITIP